MGVFVVGVSWWVNKRGTGIRMEVVGAWTRRDETTHDEGEVGQVEVGDAHGEGDVQADVQPDVVRHQVVLQVPKYTYMCVCARMEVGSAWF